MRTQRMRAPAAIASAAARAAMVIAIAISFAGVPALAAPSDNARLYQESYGFEAIGDFRAAIDALHGVTGKQRESYFHHLRLGWLHYNAGAFDASMTAYRAAISLEPGAVEPYLGLLLPQMARRAWKDAVKTGRLALERDPKNLVAQSRLAWAYYSQGRYPEAEEAYRATLAMHPANLEMRAGLGWSLLERGQHAPAEAEFRRILDVSPAYPSALAGIAKLGQVTAR